MRRRTTTPQRSANTSRDSFAEGAGLSRVKTVLGGAMSEQGRTSHYRNGSEDVLCIRHRRTVTNVRAPCARSLYTLRCTVQQNDQVNITLCEDPGFLRNLSGLRRW